MTYKKQFGNNGEQLVATHLEKKGYAIVARNYKKRFGEIDLIAQKDDTVLFIEVKTRRASYIEPGQLISPTQQRKIITTARAYISEYNLTEHILRFDAALLIGEPPHQKLTYIPNAFMQEW